MWHSFALLVTKFISLWTLKLIIQTTSSLPPVMCFFFATRVERCTPVWSEYIIKRFLYYSINVFTYFR